MSSFKTVGFAVTAIASLFAVSTANAAPTTIDFEGVADAPIVRNVNPLDPLETNGFIFTVTNGNAAVFDTTADPSFPGNESDFFGFAESNEVKLARIDGGAFNLTSLIAGPSTLAMTQTLDLTITGKLSGGGLVTQTFADLFTATLITVKFSNIIAATFRTTDDIGLDNIVVEEAVVPLPGALPLFLTAVAGGGFLRRKRAAARA